MTLLSCLQNTLVTSPESPIVTKSGEILVHAYHISLLAPLQQLYFNVVSNILSPVAPPVRQAVNGGGSSISKSSNSGSGSCSSGIC